MGSDASPEISQHRMRRRNSARAIFTQGGVKEKPTIVLKRKKGLETKKEKRITGKTEGKK